MLKHRTSLEFPADLWHRVEQSIPERKRSMFIIESIKEKLERESIKTLVLCGGQGTRMRPLTFTMSKAMLPLGYKPLLEHIVNYFKGQGIYNFVFSLGYLAEQIIKYFGDGNPLGAKIQYAIEKDALGTGGGIKNSENLLTMTFVSTNCDILLKNLNLKEAIQFHKDSNALATLILAKEEDARRFGLVDTDKEGAIISFKEKPKYAVSGWVNTGMYIFEPKIFDYIPKNKFVSLENDIFPKLIGNEKIVGYKYHGWRMDIATPEDYEKAVKDFFTRR